MKALITLMLMILLVPNKMQATESTVQKIQVSQDCKKSPVFCKILKLKPEINKQFAAELSLYITRYSKKFGFDPNISVAIAMQESSLENKNRIGTILKDGKFVNGITDVGVFQIHIRTLANLNKEGYAIDTKRLENDVEYQTYWHAFILKNKIKTCKNERSKLKVSVGSEWSCYHSFTLEQRKVYLKDVSRHLVKLARM